MGKQINYWMDYDNFLLVAQMAVDLGCTVVKEDLKLGKVIESKDAGIITPYGTSNYPGYYFHLPEAGDIRILTVNGKECLDYGYTATGNSGYHDENKKDIPRPDCLTKVHNSLVKYVKKAAPYTVFVEIFISTKDENHGEAFEYRHKEYITKTCLNLVNNEG